MGVDGNLSPYIAIKWKYTLTINIFSMLIMLTSNKSFIWYILFDQFTPLMNKSHIFILHQTDIFQTLEILNSI